MSLSLDDLSATVATELAAGLMDAKGAREKYGITIAQWEILKNNKTFRAMLKEAIQRLGGDMNAHKRTTLKAEVALEDSVGILYRLVKSPETPAPSRIEGIKTLAQLSGRNNKEAGSGSGTGFSININFSDGHSNKGVTIDGKALPEPE